MSFYFAYSAIIIFIVGLLLKFIKWLNSPNPLSIPTQPAPLTFGGVIVRVFKEVVLFKSLFEAEKSLWVAGWIFHVSFLVIVLRHLRYFVYPVPSWIVGLNTVGIFAGYTLVLSIGYLILRRVINDRVLYISSFMDYAILFLILLIGITGLTMQLVHKPMLVDIKAFTLGIVHFSHEKNLELSGLFTLHFTLVLILLIYFPFSKLLHAPGVFLSPTRVQPDTPREYRLVNPWDKSGG
jgi:nitrate reductase gamma subunit